jgi:hypothetical protein
MSEVKHNVWFEPVPDYLTSGALVFVVTWKAPKENHDKIVAHSADGMNVQRVIPNQVAYSRTRMWFKPSDDDAVIEEWWFMDEYDSAEAFEAMQQLVRQSFLGPDSGATAKRHQELLSLLVPGTEMVPVLYSEIGPSRIEFEPFTARSAVIIDELERRTAKAAANTPTAAGQA